VTTRLVAAAVGLAVLIPSLVFGGVLAVEIIIVLVSLVVLTEYAAMAFPDDRHASFAWLLLGWGAVYTAWLHGPQGAIAPTLGGLVLATLVFVTLRPGPELSRAADRAGRYVLGIGWIALLASFVGLRRFDDGLAWIFLVLAISWCGDTGGYFAGRFFGKHKLYPRISPKKTWEGVAGGVALAVVGVFVVRAVGLPQLSPAACVAGGAAACLLGVVGDLSESMMKRAFDVKDSGWIMPGHGGLLDRIDSVLFVAPAIYGYAVLMEG